MSGGGKGGSTTSQVQIPAWLESAARQNLSRANDVSRIGYTPYFGPDVAALQPSQIAAMQNTNQAASAFGMAAPTDVMAGMPQAQQFAGGIQGYSSAPAYQQSVDALAALRPGQYNAIQSMFVDPMTGQMAGATPGPQGFDWANSGRANAAPTTYNAFRDAMSGGFVNGGNAEPTRAGSGSGGLSLSGVTSYLPGGVNTRDPGSLKNTVAAALTSGTQRAPTSSDRPAARPASTAKR